MISTDIGQASGRGGIHDGLRDGARDAARLVAPAGFLWRPVRRADPGRHRDIALIGVLGAACAARRGGERRRQHDDHDG